MKQVRIGFCGPSRLARDYGAAFLNSVIVFGAAPAVPVLEAICCTAQEDGPDVVAALGFRRSVASWRELVEDPSIDIMVVAGALETRAEIVLAAIGNRKHVYSEAPLTTTWHSTRVIADAAERSKVTNLIGYNFLHNPIQSLSRELIADGALGEPVFLRAAFDRDGPAAGEAMNVLTSLCVHPIGLALTLLGPIARVSAMTVRSAVGGSANCGSEWGAQFICEFESGALGHIAASRVGTGRELGLTYEIQGTSGAICFSQERMNELDLYRQSDPSRERGFKTIYAGPDHGSYGSFHPVAGVALGHNDQKTIEAREMVLALAEGRPAVPNFRFGQAVERVVAAIVLSSKRREWVRIRDVDESDRR